MKKTVWVVAVTMLLALSTSWAGDQAKMDHEAMMAEMMNCTVCGNMAPRMAEMMPVMNMECVDLTNGMVMMHSITDPAKVAEYHEIAAAVSKAGEACMSFSDTEASEKLCHFCQTIRHLGQAGASISHGMTQTGDMLVITSEDPAVQTQIAEFEQQAKAMTGSS